LQTDGGRALTTNAIAEFAGVSIGTLYQYFPDKKAILIALARQELAVTDKAVSTVVAKAAGNTVMVDPVRAAIRALINGFKGRQRTRKVLIEVLFANGLADELTLPVDNAMRELLAAQAQGVTAMKPVTAYVLTRAVIGTLRAALMEQSAYLGKPEFEDELVKLVRALMTA
jgi:AcrR family transcriptional regulator